MGITNDVIYYLKKNFSRFTDIFSDNFSIDNFEVDSINNIATITTTENHGLRQGLNIFIDNVFYCYSIDSIVNTELEYFLNNKRVINNVLKITTTETFFNAIQYDSLFKIDSIASETSLNSIYKVVYSEITQDEDYNNKECIIYCLPVDESVDITNINILNEGLLKIKYTDDTSVKSGGNDSSFGVISRVSGCYNGFKIVNSIIDEKTFTVELSNLQTRPDYTDIIDFSSGICKTNIKVLPCNVGDIDSLVERAYSTMKENKQSAFLFLARDDSNSSNYGSSFDSTTESINTAFDVYNEDISFTGTLLFRVVRDSSIDNIGHLVLGGEANDIIDNLFKISRFLINNLFVNIETELTNNTNIDSLYKSTLSNFGSATTYANIENSVFKISTFNFKVSKYTSGYNADIINNFGLPIKNININIDFNKTDSSNINIS